MAIQGCPTSRAGGGNQGGIHPPPALLRRCSFLKVLFLAILSLLSHLAFLSFGKHPKAALITTTSHSQTLCCAPRLSPSLPTSQKPDCSKPSLKKFPPLRAHRHSEGLPICCLTDLSKSLTNVSQERIYLFLIPPR